MNPKITMLILFFGINSSITKSQQTVGLFLNDPSAYNGYVLFAPFGHTETYLIDNCGNIVQSWVSNYPPGSSVYLLENGNLLRTARINGSFNGGGTGGRIEMFNWDGALIWSYNYASSMHHQHHDIAYMPNGHILLLAWEKLERTEAIAFGRNPLFIDERGLWSEHIVEIEPTGTNDATILWEWHLWDHFVQDYDPNALNYGLIEANPGRVDLNFSTSITNSPDFIHCNSINYNPELDKILLSARLYSEIWIIDHNTTTNQSKGSAGDLLYRWGNPRAYSRGLHTDQKLFLQHDASWIEQGLTDENKIIVFNNGAGRPGGNYSSVEIIAPPVDNEGVYMLSEGDPFGPDNSSWTYTDEDPFSLFAPRISGAQRLQNGNTLICDGTAGHIFELSPQAGIVWDYISPIGTNGPLTQGSIQAPEDIFKALKYSPEYGAFEGKELIPGPPLELDSFPSECEIYPSSTAVSRNRKGIEFNLSPNPVARLLYIENQMNSVFDLAIFDIRGQPVYSGIIISGLNEINAEELISGLYVVCIFNDAAKRSHYQKIVKQ
jgi:hypothetical protein